MVRTGRGKRAPTAGRESPAQRAIVDGPAVVGRRGLWVMGTRLYVGNLPFDADASQLRTLFQEGGRTVTDVKIIMDRDTPLLVMVGLVQRVIRVSPEAASCHLVFSSTECSA